MNTTKDGQVLYRVRVSELKEHLAKRSAHHVKRNEEYVAKGKAKDAELNSKVADAETTSDRMAVKGSSSYSNDAHERDTAFNMAREHAQRAARFAFLAEHSPINSEIDGDVLFIAESELRTLEFFQ